MKKLTVVSCPLPGGSLLSFVLFVTFVVVSLAFAGGTVIRTQVDMEILSKQDIEIRRGETITIEPRYRSYGEAYNLTNTTNVLLFYKPSGLTNVYSITGSVYSATGGIARVTWTPAAEQTNSLYAYEISLYAASNGVQTRLYGTIKLQAGVQFP